MKHLFYHPQLKTNPSFLFREGEVNNAPEGTSEKEVGHIDNPYPLEFTTQTSDGVELVLKINDFCSKIQEYIDEKFSGKFLVMSAVGLRGGGAYAEDQHKQTIQIKSEKAGPESGVLLGISEANLDYFFDENGDLKKDVLEGCLNNALDIVS